MLFCYCTPSTLLCCIIHSQESRHDCWACLIVWNRYYLLPCWARHQVKHTRPWVGCCIKGHEHRMPSNWQPSARTHIQIHRKHWEYSCICKAKIVPPKHQTEVCWFTTNNSINALVPATNKTYEGGAEFLLNWYDVLLEQQISPNSQVL